MSSIAPGAHAGAIVAHYLKELTLRAGLRWSSENERDMQTLASLLDLAGPQDDASDTIPPYKSPSYHKELSDPPALDTRVTQELDYGDPAFARWRAARADEERVDQARRIVRRT